MSNYLVSVANRSESIYEMQNIVNKREKFYVIERLDWDTIIGCINERYVLKEDKMVVAKVINLTTDEQLTLEFDCLNDKLYVKQSNPTNNLSYNTDPQNTYVQHNISKLWPLTVDKLLEYSLIQNYQ